MSDDGHIYEIVAPEGDVLTHYWAKDERHAIAQHHYCYCAPFHPVAYTPERWWADEQKRGFTVRIKQGVGT